MQIVGYRSDAPALLISEAGAVRRQSLAPGTELAYTLAERHCAGTIDGECHVACERERAPYCELHTTPWAVANNRDSEAEHAIYLAAFAPAVFKVGVTRLERLETRLREQGADRAAHISTVPNGRIARERETAIGLEHDITERVRVATKLRGFGESVDESSWNDLLTEFDVRETFAFDYELGLDGRPLAETMLSGVVRGSKGRVLVLDHRDTTYAVDLRDLVGYELSEGATDRELQASLDGFA
ncbi:DUF2797 domain-containing protein [Halococcus thailandensis]|uniref:DUF2797 domain-containing protein n=1 Tax=Halococcus thailandensis JCM 13552 TaxID=1227457 RepID=M0N639_9EURY|nr:DUF2797 domain-containing protein [Halococcus thailandensis]EMA52155.1 hypothetical protein C451_12642 [Halococcus thailandensis JCM 13552]